MALVDNKKIGLPLIIFCNVSLAVHDDEHIERFKEEIRNIDEIMESFVLNEIKHTTVLNIPKNS